MTAGLEIIGLGGNKTWEDASLVNVCNLDQCTFLYYIRLYLNFTTNIDIFLVSCLPPLCHLISCTPHIYKPFYNKSGLQHNTASSTPIHFFLKNASPSSTTRI